jgi:hypothetical protein
LWAYDPVNAKLLKTDAKIPPHPAQARASAVWRNTDISISIGTGVQALNGDVLNTTGLDRDQGLRLMDVLMSEMETHDLVLADG